MRALIQRVSSASVTVDDNVIGDIGAGLLVLVCAMPEDTETTAAVLAAKIAKLRIFADEQGRMNKSVLDCAGSVLAVSQFTLAADTSRGNRPGFSSAAPPDQGKALYEKFCEHMAAQNIPVETGEFGADMAVALVNDGPVTIWIDTDPKA